MNIALYIEDGLEQIVLTPETPTEASILQKIHDGSRELSLRHGQFYRCMGGWVRQSDHEQKSTMIVLERKEPQP